MCECIMGIIKYLVFFFNFVVAIVGLVLLVLGVIIVANVSQINDEVELAGADAASILLLIMGAIIFLIAFFGCCGAIKESRGLLLTYGVILVILFVLQVAVAIYAFSKVNNDADVKKAITDSLYKVLERAKNGDKLSMEFMDNTQQTFECCGVSNPTDWGIINTPKSCFKDGNAFKPFLHGCGDKLFNVIIDSLNTIALVAIILTATELIAAALTFMLRSSFH